MEWLERSQKKHCELCKTPFRFTKLYERDMPAKLPWPTFAKYMARSAVQMAGTWIRGVFVGAVWLGVLPWVMRCIWGFLFYLADGGWWIHERNQAHPILAAAIKETKALIDLYGYCMASPLFPEMATSAKVARPMNGFWQFFVEQANNNAKFRDLSYKDVMRAMFYPAAFDAYGLPPSSRNFTSPTITYNTDPSIASFARKPEMILRPSSSLLSSFRCLQNLTRNPSLNRVIIDVLEGQIITIVVVICFILVFLIREWVVQQQPEINVGDGFNARVPNLNREDEDEDERNRRVRDEVQRLMRGLEERNERERLERLAQEGARIIVNDAEEEARIDAQWGPLEQIETEEGMRFIRRRAQVPDDPTEDNYNPLESQGATETHDGSDENGELIPTIGASSTPTTEYTLRGKTEEEKKRIVHDKLLEHVRFIIPGIAGKVADLMMQEGLNTVLSYIDYDDAIGLHATQALVLHNHDLLSKGKEPLLTKEPGKSHVLEALISYMADYYSGDREEVLKVFMELPLDVLLEDLADPQRMKALIHDLTGFGNGSQYEPGIHTLNWREMVLAKDAESDWEESDEEDDEDYVDVDDEAKRHREYLKSVRQKRMERDLDIFGDDGDRGESSAPTGNGGLSPERARYMAELNTKRGTKPQPKQAEPFKFNFFDDDVADDEGGPNYADKEENAIPTPPGSTIRPATPTIIDDADGWGSDDEPTASGQGRTNARQPTSAESGDESNKDSIRTAMELPQDAQTEDEDTSDTQQPTPDDSGIEGIDTELRTPEEVAEAAHLEAEAQAARIEAARPKTLAGKLALWLWGDIDDEVADGAEAGADDEHIVDDIDAEEPFVPVNHGHHEHHHEHDHGHDLDHDDGDVLPPRADPAIINAGFADDLADMDPDAIDEAEDFDGIMELVGMRGPPLTLVQNAMIGIILLAITVFIGVWIPYIVGKITLLLVAHPIETVKAPLKLLFKTASVVQDIALVIFGGLYYTFIKMISTVLMLFGKRDLFLADKNDGIAGIGAVDAIVYAESAIARVLADLVIACSPDSEIPYFSAMAHESLNAIRSTVSSVFDVRSILKLFSAATLGSGKDIVPLFWLSAITKFILSTATSGVKFLVNLPALLIKPETWVITLSSPAREQALDIALSHWGALDRAYAILAGYATFIVLGMAYIARGQPFSASLSTREWEHLLIDMLNQAGGVLKVILIISIEMLVFPLYCGLLLDAATLPLFEGATAWGRLLQGWGSPFTSAFVHWFVGTCYMFHFALFVSMCRKILRKGTLYFIRDPDDPTFHPVRDVLERNVATQLRKISFSAGVYGALVLVCLGGVVWTLPVIFHGVLPIRWSSNAPVLEFPVDLLFYNFLMPLAVKYFKPSEGLHTMYEWWFNTSAHFLRLSHFLLGERRLDEELWAAPGTHGNAKQLSEGKMKAIIESQAVAPPPVSTADPPTSITPPIDPIDPEQSIDKAWINRGRYVRAPASDMVRIPKKKSVFLPVNAKNERLDGLPEPAGSALHAKDNSQFMMVYHPPQFRYRVGIFIFALWMFAAVTGCSATLLPLILGRRLFAHILPAEVERNDVYAFAMGFNILGSIAYGIYHLRTLIMDSYDGLQASDPVAVVQSMLKTAGNITKLALTYIAFVGVCPALMAGLVECYLILPAHTFVAPKEEHTVHLVQSWVLGLMVFNGLRRLVLSRDYGFSDSRAAAALRRMVRNGYADLDVGLAWRGFIIPFIVLSSAALVLPVIWAAVAVKMSMLMSANVSANVMAYRGAYPIFMAVCLIAGLLVAAMRKLGEWRGKVRDEVYLIGERLHNFGERGKGKGGVVVSAPARRPLL